MISFAKIMRQVLTETMSFMDLWRTSDPARKVRSKHVKTKSLGVDSIDGQEAWIFSYKSDPAWSTTGTRWQGYVRFLKENVENVDSAKDLQCMVDCSCFSGNTLILMEDGSYKPIKDIIIGDMVYTHKGRVKKVINTMIKRVDINDSIYKIKVCGFPNEMIVTGDHPFYTLRGNDYCICGCNTPIWESVYSHKCSSPDLILSRKYAKGHYRETRGLTCNDNCNGVFSWIPVKELRLHEWFLSPWLEKNEGLIDNDFARLVGYYIAEGCIPSHKGTTVRLTFNINEWDTLGKDVGNICDKLGFNYSLFKSNHGNWFDVRINDKSFRTFCIENIGQGCLTKKISLNVMKWNNDALKNLLIGAILGDGWIDPQKGMKYFSINFDLISQISTILNKLQVRHNISVANNNDKSDVNHTVFQVIIPRGKDAEIIRELLFPYLREKDKFISSQEDLRSKHHSRIEGHLKSIKLYEKIQYDGFVYDITVEDDESFIAHGIAVHNCPDYRFRWAYANNKAGASPIGNDSLNGNNGSVPTKYNLGTGMCKHLLALGEYLRTQWEPVAPTPEVPIQPKEPITHPTVPLQKSKVGVAPEPEEPKEPPKPKFPTWKTPYSDTRSGDLMESKVSLKDKIDNFVKTNPNFEVKYEDE